MAILGVDEWAIGDFAADILFTQSRRFQLLLTGHHSLHGVRHPGPFYMMVQVLGEKLLQDWTNSILMTHRLAVMACNAAFLGLFAALVHRYGREFGAPERTSFAAAIAATAAISLFSSILGNRTIISELFIPMVITLPLLTLLMGGILALRGMVLGLLAASFSLAVLVHAYIPMPLIAGPAWLIPAVLGHIGLKRRTGSGFSAGAWAGVAGIGVLFLTPIVLDAILNPPGNIVRILASSRAIPERESLRHTVTVLYRGVFYNIHWLVTGFLMVLTAGLAGVAWRWGFRRDILAGAGLTALIGMLAATFFLIAPAPTSSYMASYLRIIVLFPVALVAAMSVLFFERRHRRWVVGGVVAILAAALITMGQLTIFPKTLYLRLAVLIADEVPPGSTVALDLAPRPSAEERSSPWPPAVIPGLMLSLDRLGINACHPNPYFTYYFTRWRICPPTQEFPTYGIEVRLNCPADMETVPTENLKLGDFGRLLPTTCVRMIRVGPR